jgi:hypothetical protein
VNKAELEAEVIRLHQEITRRDRILRTCYYRVLQIRDGKQMSLLEDMREWSATPASMKPRV